MIHAVALVMVVVFIDPSLLTAETVPPAKENKALALPAETREFMNLARTPYQVELVISRSTQPADTQLLRQLSAEIHTALQSRFMEAWDISSTTDHEFFSTTDELKQLHHDRISTVWNDQQRDKVFFIFIDTQQAQAAVQCREWDQLTGTIGPVFTTSLTNSSDLADAVTQTVTLAFRPVMKIIDSNNSEVLAVAQAAGLTVREDVQFYKPGDLLSVHQQLNPQEEGLSAPRSGSQELLQIQTQEFPFYRLKVLTSAPASAWPAVQSQPLLGLRIRPDFPETSYRVFPINSPHRPLSGVRCVITEESAQVGTDTLQTIEDSHQSLRTNFSGEITISADSESPLKRIHLYRGHHLIASAPILPGMSPEADLQVPHDGIVLQFEGEISRLREELKEIVTTREYLKEQIRIGLENRSWEQVKEQIALLEGLPKSAAFLAKIQAQRVHALYLANQSRYPIDTNALEKLASDLRLQTEEQLHWENLEPFLNEVRPQLAP